MKTGIPLGRFAASVPLVVLVSLTGCKTWQPIEASPASWIAQERPQEVRVTTESGARVTFRSPVVANDSIVSPMEGLPVMPRRGVALADLRTLEVARFNAVKSAALAAGILAASISWATTASQNKGGVDNPEPPPPKLWPGLGFTLRIFP